VLLVHQEIICFRKKYCENRMDENSLLWRVLSIEEDILQSILLHLDCNSLLSLELTCKHFRQFIQRTFTWKKLFEVRNKDYCDGRMESELKTVIKRSINRTKGLHLKYKHTVLRLNNLKRNLEGGFCAKAKVNFPKVVGANGDEYMIRNLRCNSLFVHDEGEFYPSHIFDFESMAQKRLNIDTYNMFSVSSSDIENGILALLRESTVYLNANSEVFYVVETYSLGNDAECNKIVESYKLKEQSELQGESNIGICVKVKICILNILLLSIMKKNQKMHGIITTFCPEEGNLIKQGTIFCPFPENAFSKKLAFLTSTYFGTCRPGRRTIDIWNLTKTNAESKNAELVWEKEVITGKSFPAINCSALDFDFPYVLVGKSNGRCDIWHMQENILLRTIEHGLETGLHMGIRKVKFTRENIYSLTECGWLFSWKRSKCSTGQHGKENKKDLLSWVVKNKNGKKITNFSVGQTKIATIEQHQSTSIWQSKMFLVVRDFWNHREKSTSLNRKRKRGKEDPSQITKKRKKN